MLMYSGVEACREHSNFLKVKVAQYTPCNEAQKQLMRGCRAVVRYAYMVWTDTARQKLGYVRFYHNNFNIRYWSWNYRGCWHQTCPPVDSLAEI